MASETAFEEDRVDETSRHVRILLAAAAVLNALFLFTDWRFVGTPHFWVAVPTRIAVIAVALGCAMVARRTRGRVALQRLMESWMLATAPLVGLLCTSQSEIALLVMLLLPGIYYLCVPVPFRSLVIGGIGASLATLAGYLAPGLEGWRAMGLVLVQLMLNVALVIAVTRRNRHERLAWLATRTEQRLRTALEHSRHQMERLFAASPVPLLLSDRETGRMVRMSDSCADLLGRAEPHTLLGLYAVPGAPLDLTRALDEGAGGAEFEAPVVLPDGGVRTLLVKATELDIDGRAVVLAGLLDITQRKAEQTSLERLASTDALTGLRNRLSFFSAARAEMLRAARGRTPLALLMIDIDHFKAINDGFGHQAGDAALRAFAALCQSQFGRRAIVGRLGGEEFGVLLPQTGIAAATLCAEDLRAAAAAMLVEHGGGEPIRLTVSIGAAGVRSDDRDIDGALARADLALYAAKRSGRDRVAVDDAATTGRRSA